MVFIKIRWAKKVRIRRSSKKPQGAGMVSGRGISWAGSITGLLMGRNLFSIAQKVFLRKNPTEQGHAGKRKKTGV
jgi:hypothetical protein